jgi:hypothetical protein
LPSYQSPSIKVQVGDKVADSAGLAAM